jgi:hypothetical protein
MRRLLSSAALVALVTVLAPATSYAQQQSLNFYLGGFVPKGEDSRTDGDVLVKNLSFLTFNLKDFNTGAVGGEWQFPLNRLIDGSVGLGFSTRSVPSVYSAFVADDRSEIEQTLKLRIVPFTAMIRLLPLGHDTPVQPYVGAGVGIFSWRYSETGQFIDFSDGSLFRDRFVGSGATAGPVIVGGLMFQPGPWGFGGEIRYQSAQGELPNDQFFAGDKIDLGGFTYSATFKIRF